jgi:hypothetical protein
VEIVFSSDAEKDLKFPAVSGVITMAVKLILI